MHTSVPVQLPHEPPQPSSPQVLPVHFSLHFSHFPTRHSSVPVQVPQVPPQPSSPQTLPSQLGLQHWYLVQTSPLAQVPHCKPQNSPHFSPSQLGLAGQGLQL